MKTRNLILLLMIALTGASCHTNPSVPAQDEKTEASALPADMQKMITAKVFVKPGSEADFISAARVMIDNSNKEEGCTGYMLYQDPYESTNFIFVESYRNQAAIDAHFATPYFKEFGNKTAEMTSRPMEIKIIDVSGVK